MHELFDVEPRLVGFETELLSHCPLVVEQDPVFLATGEHMQRETDLPQPLLAEDECLVLLVGEKAVVDKRAEGFCAEITLGDPADHLNVAQSARPLLDIGFEIVRRVVVLQMPLVLLLHLGGKENVGWPDPVGRGALNHGVEQCPLPGHMTGLEQVRGNADVLLGERDAFRDRANALADFQADIPQQHDEFRDRLGQELVALFRDQKQQVDIRCGVQFGAPVAADCDERGLLFTNTVFPEMLQDGVDEQGAAIDQIADRLSGIEQDGELFADILQRFLEQGDREFLAGLQLCNQAFMQVA